MKLKLATPVGWRCVSRRPSCASRPRWRTSTSAPPVDSTERHHVPGQCRLGGRAHNLLITGATGCGKSFLGCALANAALRQGHTALYIRTPRLLAELALGRADGRYVRRWPPWPGLASWCSTTSSSRRRAYRSQGSARGHRGPSQVRSTLVVTQLPVETWHAA